MLFQILPLERPLISIDLETTGVFHTRDRICQIGLVKLYPDGRTTEWETLINPTISIPEEASAVHHITDEMVADEPTFEMIAKILHGGLVDCDLLGYNIKNFDLKFLTTEFARCKIKYEEPHIVDGYKIFQHFPTRNLPAAVQEYLKEELLDAHSALADAKASMRVFHAQLLKHEELPRTVPELHKLFFEKADSLDPDGRLAWRGDEVIINFGKFAGTPLKNANRGYLEWVLNGNFSEATKKIIRDALNGVFPERKNGSLHK
jgi:DNA polymerase-3 subunit epsilon